MNDNQALVGAVQKLLLHPTNPWRVELQILLQRAEAGEDIRVETIDLLSPHDNVRYWMNEQLSVSSTRLAGTGYDAPAGALSNIHASLKWICPEKGCTESLPVIIEGEDPPSCPVHTKKKMTRRRKKG